MPYTRDFSRAPSASRADAVFYGGTQYSGFRSMVGLLWQWRRVRRTMTESEGYLGHHIWYRFPFTFGTVSFFATQQQMMTFARSLQHKRAARWMYEPGVSDGSFFRILTPQPNGYTNGIWSADPDRSEPNAAVHAAEDNPPPAAGQSLSEETREAGPAGQAWNDRDLFARSSGLMGRALLSATEAALRLPHARATLDNLGNGAVPVSLVHRLGQNRAEAAVRRAGASVPALRDFYENAGPDEPHASIGTLRVPITDKQNYILKYSIADRCLGGRVPSRGVTIDESSGSSGTPNNWLRTTGERQVVQANINQYVRSCLGSEPYLTINAFSLGAWATGLNMGAALERGSVVKNTGPDASKILLTLAYFGPSQRYLLCTYPPFLKHLVDIARETGFDLTRYRLAALVGGKGMSEGLRDYLRPIIDPIFSGYGASDVEIGLAGETPLSLEIRRMANRDADLRHALFGTRSRLPMLFQYNPFEYHVTMTPDDELVYTITRPGVLSPVIAYNLHDEGGVATFAELAGRLADAGVDLRSIARKHPRSADAPFVWVFGRKDSTVSVMGANVYPEDIEQSLYSRLELARIVRSYCLGLIEVEDGLRRATASFEVLVDITPELVAEFDDAIFAGIHQRSPDFREAYKNRPDLVRPVVELFRPGEGPFADDDWRIKQKRLISQATNA